MNDSSKRKSEFLGMPHGTACSRLRKMVLFDVLCRHQENICARCGNKIEIVEELSIEHVKPWEGILTELFWDLSNIAFSHLHCNVGAGRRPLKKYFTKEDRISARRDQNARYMREAYTPEKRREKYDNTGY